MTNTNNYELKEPNALTTENKTSDKETTELRSEPEGFESKLISIFNLKYEGFEYDTDEEKIKVIKQLHDQSIQIEKNKEYRYTKKEELICQLKDYENQLKEKDKVISLRNIEITQRKQDYKELQTEIQKLKEMQKSLLCSIGNIRGNLANYQINHNEQQLNDIYEICNENLN